MGRAVVDERSAAVERLMQSGKDVEDDVHERSKSIESEESDTHDHGEHLWHLVTRRCSTPTAPELPRCRFVSKESTRSTSSDESCGGDLVCDLKAPTSCEHCGLDDNLILLDWDDTLFPTTHFAEPHEPARDARWLAEHSSAIVAFLRTAASLAHVHVVTMATPFWIDKCLSELAPEVKQTFEELHIPIAFARDGATTALLREACADDRDPSQFFKTRAMKQVVKSFMKETAGRGHAMQKNILSIGDSEAEEFALQDVLMKRFGRPGSRAFSTCRCKTLKMVDSPDMPTLTQELGYIKECLPVLLEAEGDVDAEVNEDHQWRCTPC